MTGWFFLPEAVRPQRLSAANRRHPTRHGPSLLREEFRALPKAPALPAVPANLQYSDISSEFPQIALTWQFRSAKACLENHRFLFWHEAISLLLGVGGHRRKSSSLGRTKIVGYFDFNYFVAEFAKATDMDSLHATLEQATHDLGFQYFAMGHHVDLNLPPEGIVRLTNYHQSWIGQIIEEGFFADDPIHAASTKSLVGFLWHDVGSLIDLSDRQKHILETASKFGLAAGCTVPAHVPGEFFGTCSFGAPSLDRLRDDSLPAAYIVGAFAFEAARRIVRRQSRFSSEQAPSITPRQMEALIWVGRGKADSEISTLMGISRATAHEHVEHVRRAYGNAQRVHLIVRALFDGVVTFTDLLCR